MKTSMAKMEIGLMDAEVKEYEDFFYRMKLTNLGVPQEIISRFNVLLDAVQKIGDHFIEIGRIIVAKILEFVEAHPNMTAGVAIGAAAGALINAVPFIGPLLSPIIAAVSAIGLGTIGVGMDERNSGRTVKVGKIVIAEDLITLGRTFFSFLIEVFEALREYFKK